MNKLRSILFLISIAFFACTTQPGEGDEKWDTIRVTPGLGQGHAPGVGNERSMGYPQKTMSKT